MDDYDNKDCLLDLLIMNKKTIESKDDFSNSILKMIVYGGNGFKDDVTCDFFRLQRFYNDPDGYKLFIEYINNDELYIRKIYMMNPLNPYNKNVLLEGLTKLSELEIIICWKSLRVFIDNTLETIEYFNKKSKDYNPQNPDEDENQLFDWQFSVKWGQQLDVIKNNYSFISVLNDKDGDIKGFFYRRFKHN